MADHLQYVASCKMSSKATGPYEGQLTNRAEHLLTAHDPRTEMQNSTVTQVKNVGWLVGWLVGW
jgi:hypothetical protein